MRSRSGGFSHSAPKSAASSRTMAAALRRTTLLSFEGVATVGGMVTQAPKRLDDGRGIAGKYWLTSTSQRNTDKTREKHL